MYCASLFDNRTRGEGNTCVMCCVLPDPPATPAPLQFMFRGPAGWRSTPTSVSWAMALWENAPQGRAGRRDAVTTQREQGFGRVCRGRGRGSGRVRRSTPGHRGFRPPLPPSFNRNAGPCDAPRGLRGPRRAALAAPGSALRGPAAVRDEADVPPHHGRRPRWPTPPPEQEPAQKWCAIKRNRGAGHGEEALWCCGRGSTGSTKAWHPMHPVLHPGTLFQCVSAVFCWILF